MVVYIIYSTGRHPVLSCLRNKEHSLQVGSGDMQSAGIVAMIAEEERAHVAVGSTWFSRVCLALDLPVAQSYRRWVTALCPDLLKVLPGLCYKDVQVDFSVPLDFLIKSARGILHVLKGRSFCLHMASKSLKTYAPSLHSGPL